MANYLVYGGGIINGWEALVIVFAIIAIVFLAWLGSRNPEE